MLTPLLAGRWRLGPEIGRGGSAVLRRAEDVVTGRIVAVKQPRRCDAADGRAELCAAMRVEAEILSRLGHPSMPAIYAAGEENESPYLVLPYFPGPDLRTHLHRAGPMSPGEAAATLDNVANTLAWLHRAGWAHCDVKPANMVRNADDSFALVDFGSAAAAGAPRGPSHPRVLTPAYAAPGQIRGEAVDPRDDVYALAVIAYQLVTGRHPFAQRTVQPGECASQPVAMPLEGWTGLAAALNEDARSRPDDARQVLAALRSSRRRRWAFARRRTA